MGFIPAAVAAAAVFFSHFFKLPGQRMAAVFLDTTQGLHERLSTAVEMTGRDGNPPSPWAELVVRDAAGAVAAVKWKRLTRWSVPSAGWWGLLAMIAALGLSFVPEVRSKEFVQEEKNREIIQDNGREMVKVLKQTWSRKEDSVSVIPPEALLKDALELGNQLSRAELRKAGAIKKLDDLSGRVRDEISRLEQDPSQQRLKELASSPDGLAGNTAGEAVRKMEALRDALGNAAGKIDQMSAMQDEMESLREMAEQMKDQLGSPDSTASKQLQAAARSMEQKLSEMGLDPESINKALEALKDGDPEAFDQAMQEAIGKMEKAIEMAQALEQMEQELGKNLAEQLQRGQIAAARETLESLSEKLSNPNLSDEERQQVADELEQAAEAARALPQLSEALEQAAKAARQGDMEEAARQMAEAQQMLDQVMEAFQNAENLQEMLQALKRAQAGINGGRKWGRMNNGRGPGGQGMGNGGAGGGFGTWSDGSDALPDERTELQDQSGMSQAELDAKGLSDRDDRFQNDRFSPDQIRGDLDQGGSMPSMPLKGIHIKGRSNATYQEVMSEIRDSEASTIDQSRVPRAYQQAVKSYFDQ
jgi:tetratricopeptide (TPR) repeat protein